MKVPVPTSGRVVPKVQDGYLQAQSVPGLGDLVRGVQSLGNSLSRAGAVFAERDQKTDRFNSLTNLSKFDTSVAESLTEMKRNYAPDGRGYVKSAETLYDQKAQEYLSTVPPDLQEEFRYRIAENKKAIVADSLRFQYDAGDAFFKQGVSDEFNKSRTLLDQQPGLLDAQRAHMTEIIDATDLPEIEKAELKRKMNIGLEAATYKAEVRKDASNRYAIGVGEIADFDSGARALIKKEEGYVPSAMWDVNHHRVGYSSDTVTAPDGSYRSVREGEVTTREDAERDLGRRIKDADNSGRKAVGAERWDALGANVKAALASVYYHYGSYPQEVIRAVETGSAAEIAQAVRGLGSNPARREREAKIIEGSSGIEADPRFQNIPYEDRLALREDADREAASEVVAQEKARKIELDTLTNNLYVGLLDGTKGKADIEAAREQGWLTDYDSINKANEILKNGNKELMLAGEAAQKLSAGGIFDPTDADDKKRLNAYVGKNGLARIAAGDQEYFSDAILPLVSQTGDIPTDVAGSLIGMVQAQDPQRARYALDALAQLRDTNPLAFNTRVNNDVAGQVDLWESQKDLVSDQGELLDRVRGGTDQTTRQARLNLRNEAKGILSQTTNGVPNSRAMLSTVTNAFDGYFSSEPGLYSNPVANQALEREFSSFFIDKYSLTGNVDSATKLAVEELKRNWGATEVGGRKILMKYPPEKVGYRPVEGSYDWINESVKQDLKLPPGERFELYSDDQTREEFLKFQRDPNAQPPSYRIFVIDKDGVPRERVDERNKPARLYFKPPIEILAEEADAFDREAERFRVEDTIMNFPRLQAGALASGTKVPEEDEKAYRDALKARDALDKADAEAEQRKLRRKFPDLPEPAFPNTFPTGSF